MWTVSAFTQAPAFTLLGVAGFLAEIFHTLRWIYSHLFRFRAANTSGLASNFKSRLFFAGIWESR